MVDQFLSRIFSSLDDVCDRLRDNTLIVFQNDNGGTRSRMFAGVMPDMWRASEKNNAAAQHPAKVATSQQRLDKSAKQSEKPLFLMDQFKVITKGMHGEPILPTDDDFAGVEEP